MATSKKSSKVVKETQKVSRTPRIVRAKLVNEALNTADKSKYTVEQAAEMLPKLCLTNYKGSATLNVILSLKEKQNNESVRGSIVFPNQFGEIKRVLVLTEGEKQTEAKEAGADFVGLDDMVAKIDGGWLEFDVVIATPNVMAKIARLGKVLGPKQLMPNPKTGTVTDNLKAAIKSYKSGKVDFKMDAGKTIKVRFGTMEMSSEQLAGNLTAAIEAIKSETRKLGPTAIKKMLVNTTMGPSIRLEA